MRNSLHTADFWIPVGRDSGHDMTGHDLSLRHGHGLFSVTKRNHDPTDQTHDGTRLTRPDPTLTYTLSSPFSNPNLTLGLTIIKQVRLRHL